MKVKVVESKNPTVEFGTLPEGSKFLYEMDDVVEHKIQSVWIKVLSSNSLNATSLAAEGRFSFGKFQPTSPVTPVKIESVEISVEQNG